jgi:hypothetical protein
MARNVPDWQQRNVQCLANLERLETFREKVHKKKLVAYTIVVLHSSASRVFISLRSD